jgi:broad specificity phosphatase PhoE
VAFTIDLIPHLDAGDRDSWPGDQDERPLSDLGRRQASALADALAKELIDAIYAGPALRCRQSLDVLARRLGLNVDVLPEFGEKQAWRAPDGWEASTSLWPAAGLASATSAAFAAGSIALAIDRIRALHQDGHVVACSHGHTIPAYVAYHVGSQDLSNVPALEYRGQWYRLRFVDDTLAIDRIELPGFPR